MKERGAGARNDCETTEEEEDGREVVKGQKARTTMGEPSYSRRMRLYTSSDAAAVARC